MDLKSALRLDEFSGLSDADALNALLADDTPLENHQLQTVAAVVKAIGQDAARLVMGTLKVAGSQDPLADAFYFKVCTQGQDWADPEWQAAIPLYAQAGNWSEDIVSGLLRMGLNPQKTWQALGISAEPTLEDITTARSEIVADDQRAAFVSLLRLIAMRVEDGNIDTIESAKEAIAAG